MALGLVNKAILSSYKFDCFFLLLAGQLMLLLILCIISRDCLGNPFNVPKYEKKIHYDSLFLGCAYVANVTVGLLGVSSYFDFLNNFYLLSKLTF